MKHSLQCLVFCLLVAIILGMGTQVFAAGEMVVVRIDLNERVDFDRFCELEISPFFRIGNVFFVELERTAIPELRNSGIPTELIDDEAFSGKYYFATAESIVSRKIPITTMERLTEVGEYALYRSDGPIDRTQFREYGFDPYEIGRREIPLVYFPKVSSAPDIGSLVDWPILDSLVDVVDLDTVFGYNARLQAFQTRYSFTDSNAAARQWIKEKFEGYGYTDVSFQQFWADPYIYPDEGWAYNVVCVKPGTSEPDKVIVIGGHYDSMILDGNDPFFYAPSADDDGSGTAATMEVARVLADLPTRKTIIFIAFGAEEQWLVGSWHFANYAVYTGLDIELMINLDMIGYTENNDYTISCFYYDSSRPYTELMASLGEQFTWIWPNVAPSPGAADHLPFYESGFNIAYNQEGTFNTAGWHTELDITDRMDFPYLTEVTKMALATVYAVSAFPAPVADAGARDVGDGQSLLLEWTPATAADITGYRVYWGTASTVYTDWTFISGVSTASAVLPGLVTEQPYYLTVVAVTDNDDESFLRPEFSGTPRLVPLPPSGLAAETGEWRIDLNWSPSQELDFDHYHIYRAAEPGMYSLLFDNLMIPSYTDYDVTGGVMYDYVCTAVDADGYESDYSGIASAAAATFDQGILIVDQTPPDAGNPTTEQKEAFFAAAFAGTDPAYYYYDAAGSSLNKSVIGMYNAVFWIKDGNAAAAWKSEDLAYMRWYLDHSTDLMVAGWRTGFEFAGLSSSEDLGPGNFLYDYGGVNHVEEIFDVDLIGGVGEAGFPNVALDPSKVYSIWSGKMGWIGTLGIEPTTEVIYRYNSSSGSNDGLIVGARRQNGTSRFAFLSMPFYYLYDSDAQAVISEIAEWFGSEITCNCGDFCEMDGEGTLTPVDVVYMVNFVYLDRDARPTLPNCPLQNGDWDCSGAVNPVDVVYYVNYVYKNLGAGPCEPCAE